MTSHVRTSRSGLLLGTVAALAIVLAACGSCHSPSFGWADGLPVEVISDAGRTQVTPGTLTCCALGPAEDQRIDAVTAGLALL